MQRVPNGFVAQGGGFFFPTTNPNLGDGVNPLDRVPTFAAIPDEVGNSNVPGTISMALSGPNTATSQYFFNLGNNSGSLDPQGFTAFGRVTSGLSVLTADIENVPTYFVQNISPVFQTGQEASMPLLNIPNPPGSTVDISNLTIDNFVILRDIIVTQRRDQLQFSATSSNASVATVQLDPTKPNFLNITGVAAGTATITVTALGPSGSVQTTFQVNVA
jgi:peptidyl-prolyl cis-trans isomerase A (cyclophilin A)